MHKVDAKHDPADGAESQLMQTHGTTGQPIIVDGAIVQDTWQLINDDQVPEQGAVIVPLSVWLKQRDALRARAEPVGVWIAPDEEVEALAADVASLPLIAVDFPAFTDGRGFSTARLLKDRYAFTGELRAIGDVFKDTMFYLKRCGFTAFAVRADKNIHEALKGLNDFSEVYQGATDQPLPLFRRRASVA